MAHATAYRLAEVTGCDPFFWERARSEQRDERKEETVRQACSREKTAQETTPRSVEARSHQVVRTTWTADPIVMQLKTRKATHWANREERVLIVSPVSALILGSSMVAWLLIAVCD